MEYSPAKCLHCSWFLKFAHESKELQKKQTADFYDSYDCHAKIISEYHDYLRYQRSNLKW